jgi:putative heme iron utilization protein
MATSAAAWPYVSLVLVACDLDASPLLLLSDLAEHTKNLKRDPLASLLFDGTAGRDDPLTGPRVTVMGKLLPEAEPDRRARFVRRHPSASAYAGFHDFHLYRMEVERAHLVAGFGRIDWIEVANLLDRAAPADWLRTAEPGVLQHMNVDHADTLDLYARKLMDLTGTGWRLTGVDREGADLRRGGQVARLAFPAPVTDVSDIRQAFVALAQSAKRGARSH